MKDRLELMLDMQRQLQLKMPPTGVDIMTKTGDDRAATIRNMVLACEDELHEAMNETGWKPWATSRHINPEPFTKELIDAWHFFMNLMLIGASALDMNVFEYSDYFTKKYIEKNIVNAQRQDDGYDGVSTKCAGCKREMSETDSTQHWFEADGTKYHDEACAVMHHVG